LQVKFRLDAIASLFSGSSYEAYASHLAIRKGVKQMKIMTQALEKRFDQVGSQKDVKDPIVIAKYQSPYDADIYFATEYDPEKGIFFGYYTMYMYEDKDSWIAYSLDDLGEYDSTLDRYIREKNFRECPVSEVIKKYTINKYR
jgi:hypothetical protein